MWFNAWNGLAVAMALFFACKLSVLLGPILGNIHAWAARRNGKAVDEEMVDTYQFKYLIGSFIGVTLVCSLLFLHAVRD